MHIKHELILMKTSLDICHLIKFSIWCTSSTNTEALIMVSVLSQILGTGHWVLAWIRAYPGINQKYLLNAYHMPQNTSDIMRHKSKNVNLNSQNA